MTTPKKAAAAPRKNELEPQIMSKLDAMQSMPHAKFVETWKTIEKDVLAWTALVHGKAPRPRGKNKWREFGRFAAKLASQDLRGFSAVIAQAAETRNKHFFIALGRYLSGELKADMWDQRDVAITRMVLENPSISGKEAVRELERSGRISKADAESVFRNRKKRLRLSEVVGKRVGASRNRRLRKT